MEVKVRKLDPKTLDTLTKMARKRGISREALIREVLMVTAKEEEVLELDKKYRTLTEEVLEGIKEARDVLQLNTSLLKALKEEKLL